jgi:mono/diheme cytochrome c family protein
VLREKPEPSDANTPFPLWLIGALMTVTMVSFTYLGLYSGGFKWDVYDERPVAFSAREGSVAGAEPAEANKSPEALLAKQLQLGRRVYTANCTVCHQPGGTGIAGQYPPLSGSEWVAGHPRRIIAIVLHGARGPITVKGQAYNNVMASWGEVLKDKQIANVLTYVRKSWGNDYAPVTEEQVAAVRKELKSRKEAWSEMELKALSEAPIPHP